MGLLDDIVVETQEAPDRKRRALRFAGSGIGDARNVQLRPLGHL